MNRAREQHQRRPPYVEGLYAPPASVASQRIYVAMRVALRFVSRTPTLAELEAEFGMCRGTAYRWRGAIKAAKGEA